MEAIKELQHAVTYGASLDGIAHKEDWRGGVSIEDIIGKTFRHVVQNDDSLIFANDDEIYLFLHPQECCENVYIEDICGDLSDLEGTPILNAEEVTSDESDSIPAKDAEHDEHYTWTFYKFATSKGYVDVRWYGTSNGFYSESVELYVFPIKDGALVKEDTSTN